MKTLACSLITLVMLSSTYGAEIDCYFKYNNKDVKFVDITPQPGTPDYDDYDVEEEPQYLQAKVSTVDVEVTYLPYQEYFFIGLTDTKSPTMSLSSYSDITYKLGNEIYDISCSIKEEEDF